MAVPREKYVEMNWRAADKVEAWKKYVEMNWRAADKVGAWKQFKHHCKHVDATRSNMLNHVI